MYKVTTSCFKTGDSMTNEANMLPKYIHSGKIKNAMKQAKNEEMKLNSKSR